MEAEKEIIELTKKVLNLQKEILETKERLSEIERKLHQSEPFEAPVTITGDPNVTVSIRKEVMKWAKQS